MVHLLVPDLLPRIELVRKEPLSKTVKATATKETMTFTLEEPSGPETAVAGKKKKRPRKTIAYVIGKPSVGDITP